MRKGRNGKRGTRYYDSTGTLVGKTCSKCDEVLPVDAFQPAKSQSDGYLSACRPCTSKAQKEYRRGGATSKGGVSGTDTYRERYLNRSDEEFQEDIDRIYPEHEKQCPECLRIKTLDEFYRNKVYSTGISTWCRKCTITKASVRQARMATEDPEYYKKNSAKAMEKYKSRSDELILRIQEELYPTSERECKRCHHTKVLGDFQAYKGYPDGLSYLCKDCENEKKTIRKRRPYEDHWRANNIPFECYVCQGPYEQSDHVYPEVLGGSDEPHNRLPICAYHNGSKNGTPLETWLSTKHPELLYDVMKRVVEEYNVWPYPPTTN